MGSRIQWLVIRDGQLTNRLLGGGAGMGLDYVLGAGPDRAIGAWDGWGQLGDRWWDDAVCDGGSLIDADDRVLLFFTTQPWTAVPECAYAYRAAMLDGFSRVWAGWQVRWAYDGLAELMRYTGVDPGLARPGRGTGPPAAPADADPSRADPVTLVTVADPAGGRAYAVVGDGDPVWRFGPPLLGLLSSYQRITTVTMPYSGLHLDPGARRAGYWSIMPLRGIRDGWSAAWPGWGLEIWDDRYAEQVDRTAPPVGLAPGRLRPAVEALASRVESHWSDEVAARAMAEHIEQRRGPEATWLAVQAATQAEQPAAAAAAALIRNAPQRR